MNQLNWTYLADNGKKHVVGIYHGAQSGHLLVYCNSKIVLIDFEILEDKMYSFFIEDQLCELSIELKENKFYYGFNINKTADTPLNRVRKKVEKKHLMQSLGFIAGFIVLVLGIIFGVNSWHANNHEKGMATLLQEFGKEVSAKVLLTTEDKEGMISYYFIVNGKEYTVHSDSPVEKEFVLENGMPLEKGDEFVVRYLPENPDLCKIDYSRPTPAQIQTYLERVNQKNLSLNNELSIEESTCMIQIAFDLKGVKGLADIYCQDVPAYENPDHNKSSFQRLVRDIPFQQAKKERCGISG